MANKNTARLSPRCLFLLAIQRALHTTYWYIIVVLVGYASSPGRIYYPLALNSLLFLSQLYNAVLPHLPHRSSSPSLVQPTTILVYQFKQVQSAPWPLFSSYLSFPDIATKYPGHSPSSFIPFSPSPFLYTGSPRSLAFLIFFFFLFLLASSFQSFNLLVSASLKDFLSLSLTAYSPS